MQKLITILDTVAVARCWVSPFRIVGWYCREFSHGGRLIPDLRPRLSLSPQVIANAPLPNYN